MAVGRAMAKAVSCWPLTTEIQVYAPVSPHLICGGQSGTGTGFPLSVSFHCGSPCSYTICEMNSRLISDHSSDT
jgi:hypothetical protein